MAGGCDTGRGHRDCGTVTVREDEEQSSESKRSDLVRLQIIVLHKVCRLLSGSLHRLMYFRRNVLQQQLHGTARAAWQIDCYRHTGFPRATRWRPIQLCTVTVTLVGCLSRQEKIASGED